MRRHLALTLLIAALVICERAHAQATVDDAPEPATHWYGWQTLLADGLGIGTLALALTVSSEELAILSVSSLLVTPAILHGAHRNWLGVGVSLTLRVGGSALLLGGIAVGLAQGDWNTDEGDRATDDGPEAEIMFGLGLMAIFAAPLVDAILAREPARTPPARSWSLQPWLSAQARGGGMVFTSHL